MIYILMNEYHGIVAVYNTKTKARYWRHVFKNMTGMDYYIVKAAIR